MRKFVIGALASVSLVGGSLAIAAVNPLGIANAQDPPTTQAPSTQAPSGQGDQPDPGGKRGHRGAGSALAETLKELVANGTISQQQADAIHDSLKKKIEAKGGDKGGRDKDGRHGGMKQFAETAAAAIGIDLATFKTEIKSGKSIADVARAHGVDPQKVIDALVAKATADIDQAVAAGKMPADRAAQIKGKLGDRITKMVNGRPGEHKNGPEGAEGPDGEAGPAQPAPSTTAPAAPSPSTTAPATSAPTTQAPSTTAPAPGTTVS